MGGRPFFHHVTVPYNLRLYCYFHQFVLAIVALFWCVSFIWETQPLVSITFIFPCLFVRPIGYISIYLHYMMLKTMQPIYFKKGLSSKTKTKCFKHPMYAIFLKCRRFKCMRYGIAANKNSTKQILHWTFSINNCLQKNSPNNFLTDIFHHKIVHQRIYHFAHSLNIWDSHSCTFFLQNPIWHKRLWVFFDWMQHDALPIPLLC